jgi:predicted  nucleic acid-binding Zn-ribbon protein
MPSRDIILARHKLDKVMGRLISKQKRINKLEYGLDLLLDLVEQPAGLILLVRELLEAERAKLARFEARMESKLTAALERYDSLASGAGMPEFALGRPQERTAGVG